MLTGALAAGVVLSCGSSDEARNASGTLNIVTTTGMIGDLAHKALARGLIRQESDMLHLTEAGRHRAREAMLR